MKFLELIDVTETSMIKVVITDDMELVLSDRKHAVFCIYVLRSVGESFCIPSLNDLRKFDDILTDEEKAIIYETIDHILDSAISYQVIIHEAQKERDLLATS